MGVRIIYETSDGATFKIKKEAEEHESLLSDLSIEKNAIEQFIKEKVTMGKMSSNSIDSYRTILVDFMTWKLKEAARNRKTGQGSNL